jgi:hypothetical protein
LLSLILATELPITILFKFMVNKIIKLKIKSEIIHSKYNSNENNYLYIKKQTIFFISFILYYTLNDEKIL